MSKESLQESFLTVLKQEESPVSVFLVNGIKLHGQINDFDEHVVMLKNGVTQMIFKHAISTIVPAKPVK